MGLWGGSSYPGNSPRAVKRALPFVVLQRESFRIDDVTVDRAGFLQGQAGEGLTRGREMLPRPGECELWAVEQEEKRSGLAPSCPIFPCVSGLLDLCSDVQLALCKGIVVDQDDIDRKPLRSSGPPRLSGGLLQLTGGCGGS